MTKSTKRSRVTKSTKPPRYRVYRIANTQRLGSVSFIRTKVRINHLERLYPTSKGFHVFTSSMTEYQAYAVLALPGSVSYSESIRPPHLKKQKK